MRFVVFATPRALEDAEQLGFDGVLEVETERAIAEGGFIRRVRPHEHLYDVAGELVVRTTYQHERTPAGRRKFLIVGVQRRHNDERRTR